MENNQIVVSVICLAYNHGKYIRDCLEGFVSQKTDFAFEVIIHDDASTDNTAEIIREYEEKYPDIIKPVYQTENKFSTPFVVTYVMPKVRGEFVAMCEGDDYWTDPYKLQKQVDGMREHPNCGMCVHKVLEVNEDKEANGVTFPSTPVQPGVLSSRQFFEIGKNYSFHTSSYFFRTEQYRQYRYDPPAFVKKCDVGDEVVMLYFGALGDVLYIEDAMSCYRRGAQVSWSAKNYKNLDKLTAHSDKMIDTLKSFDEYSRYQYHDIVCHRIGYQMAKAVILHLNARIFLKKENREYFACLSGKRKMFILAAMVFPKLIRKLYLGRINKISKDRGVF